MYHTNRVFSPVTFTIPGVPTAFQVCDMAGKLTTVVGPTNVVTNSNSYVATEYQSVVVEYGSDAQAWAAVVGAYPSNAIDHANSFYTNAGWVKGLHQTDDGKWGGYIWLLQNTVDFKTSATNVWVSTNGVTNSISKVLVGTIGDYAPMMDEEDTGPGIAEGLTNWPSGGSNDMSYTANFTAYYDIGLPALWIQPMLTNVCINAGNVAFTLITNNYVTSVNWSITPTNGLTNGAVFTDCSATSAVVSVGGVATSYVVRATASDNTNIFGFALLNVIKVDIEKCNSAFLPKGGSEDNTTAIRAFVTPNTVKGKFKFTLFDVSDEKGYCLNAPTNPPASGEDSDAWKDFQFPSQTGFTISGTDNNVAETTINDLHDATVTIKSFDYGSYGKIKAEFTTQDGNLICVAKEVDGTNEYTRLPADTNGNNIADSWSGDTGPNGGYLATDDTDNLPTGNTGDGFTRHEEWRGFIVGGTHIRTSVTYRDLFIYDQNDLGVGYYPSGSGGIVCHSIDNTEWTGSGKKADGKRVVNNNRETAAGSTQYALHLIKGGSPTNAWGCAWGDPDNEVPIGPPNTCWKITVEKDAIKAALPDSWETNYVDRSIAHELGHGSAVPHHSPDEKGGNLCVMREPPDGGATEETTGTSFCTSGDNCKSKIDVKDP